MKEKRMGRNRRIDIRLPLAGAAGVVAMVMFAAAPPAKAVTIGQLAPGLPPALCANTQPFDEIQPIVPPGVNSFTVPSTGGVTAWTVSSWSHNASAGAGQNMALKFWRKVGDPNTNTYEAVIQEGFRALTPGTLNTFSGLNLSVRAGDVLGMNDGTVANACMYTVAGSEHLERQGNLANGASANFGAPNPGELLNITAVVNPTNTFTLGGISRNKNKGTATLSVTVPNPGNLTASGKGVKAGATAVESKAVGTGVAKLKIRAKGNKNRKLNDTGKVKLNTTISYTPTGGTATTNSRKVKLKKNL